MSIPILVEVYDEMRRLAIAGSSVAPGDFRLKKIIPSLTKAGEKAPVFAKVAQAAQAVIDSNEKTASSALLELATLVNAILYTQGETGIAGEFKPLETINLGGQATQSSARVLKPLLEALSSTGSGRLELIRDAVERGAFRDLRLVKAAIHGIDDPYPEIGQLLADKVLPLYGKAILPELRTTLDIKGRGGHVRRLQILHRLDPEASRDLVQKGLAEGSKEIKVAAIECLGTSEEDLVYLLEQSKAKAKDVRAAALRALSSNGTTAPAAIAMVKKAIEGADLELIVSRMRSSIPEIQDFVLQQAETHFVHTLKCKDKKEQGPAIERMQQLVCALQHRKDAKTESFLLNCLESAGAFAAIKSEPSGADFNEMLAHILARGTPKMQQRLVASLTTLTGDMLAPAFYAARATMTGEAFYNAFRPLLKPAPEKRGKRDERSEALTRALLTDHQPYFYNRWITAEDMKWDEEDEEDDDDEGNEKRLLPLDPRWLDAAVEVESLALVCRLARPGHDLTNKFLSAQLAKKGHSDDHDILRTMVRIGNPSATDALIAAIEKEAKSSTYYWYTYYYGNLIEELPRSALPKLEEMLTKLPEKCVDGLMEHVLALKNKPE